MRHPEPVSPYRDDAAARRRRHEALEQERDDALAQLARARAALASVIAEMTGLPAEADIPWRSLHGGEPIEARFINETPHKLSLSWISYDGRERAEATLVPGGRLARASHCGHLFRLRGPDGAVVAQGYLRADAPELVARP